MRCTEAKYSIRLTLGQYEHEELSATVTSDVGEEITGDEMIAEARRICVSNTTSAKKKAKKENA